MDEMTQHNAALVEETNAAIEQTEAQASELDRIIEVFKVEGGAPDMVPERQQNRAKPALRSMGNVAISKDWNEF
ncbi:hypothetical protein D9M68_993470 [compost metagenome]